MHGSDALTEWVYADVVEILVVDVLSDDSYIIEYLLPSSYV